MGTSEMKARASLDQSDGEKKPKRLKKESLCFLTPEKGGT